MTPAIQIRFDNLPRSAALEALVHQEYERVRRHCAEIANFRATIAAPHHHHRRGNHYHVRLEFGIPGTEVVIDHDPPARRPLDGDGTHLSRAVEIDPLHKDAYATVRHAFDLALRRLAEFQRREKTRRQDGGVAP